MKGLHGWMRELEKSQAAVLSTLLSELDRVTSTEDSSGMQLADIILKDATLTSNVIRISNAVQYNPGGNPVTTVSRAVINIGFKNIRSICLSLKVLETVLKDRPSTELVSMLAKSLHGAAQAKALCSDLAPIKQEEVFVASLLSHLAELLVLGSHDAEARQFKSETDPLSTEQDKNRVAEKRLGVSLTRLGKTLMKQWRIKGYVNDILSLSEEPDKISQAVFLGDEISRTSLLGWDSPEFIQVSKSVAEFKGTRLSDAKKSIVATAEETAETISGFGKGTLIEFIPTSTRKIKKISAPRQPSTEKLEPDPAIQLQVLQELTELMMGDFAVNSVFKAILKGMNNGVGLERVALAIFDNSRQKVVAKYVSGNGTEKWRERFVVRYEKSLSGFLYNLFKGDQPIWIGNSDYDDISKYLGPEYQGITGQDRFFIAPLTAKGKRIGFIYADMGMTSTNLHQQYFSGFCQFVQQAKFALNVLASK